LTIAKSKSKDSGDNTLYSVVKERLV